MGKFAQYLKRGTARQHGLQAAPLDADWSVGVTTATTIPSNRAVAIPGPADQWITRAIQNSTNLVSGVAGSGSGATNTVTGLVTATSYRVQAAWVLQGRVVSDWSNSKPATTA